MIKRWFQWILYAQLLEGHKDLENAVEKGKFSKIFEQVLKQDF